MLQILTRGNVTDCSPSSLPIGQRHYFYLKKESDTALIIIIRVRNAITEENDTRKLTQGFQSTWT